MTTRKQRNSKKKKKNFTYPEYPMDSATHAFISRDFRKLDTCFTVITPAMASHLLKYFNLQNRGIIPKSFNMYMGDLKEDRFVKNTTDSIGIAYIRGNELAPPQPGVIGRVIDATPGIALDANGHLKTDAAGEYVVVTAGERVVLINGQHRLGACASTGQPLHVGLMTGLDLEVRGAIDNGENRRISAQLEIDGIGEATRTDKIIRAWDILATRETRKYSKQLIISLMEEISVELKWVLTAIPQDAEYGTPQIAAAFVYAYLTCKDDPALLAKLDVIAQYQRTGITPDDTHPIFLLRDYFHKRRNLAKRRKVARKAAYLASYQTLNAIMHALLDMPMKKPAMYTFMESDVGFQYFSNRIAATVTTDVDTTDADTTDADTTDVDTTDAAAGS